MGGPGSGRWGWYTKKTPAEDCLKLDIRNLVRGGLVDHQLSRIQERVRWTSETPGGVVEKMASVVFFLSPKGGGQVDLELCYTVGLDDGHQEVAMSISLQETLNPLEMSFLWFTCPFIINRTPCNRRTRVLYLPPGGLYFGCRECYDLTYASCQESHKYDAVARGFARRLGLGFWNVKELLQDLGDAEWEALRRSMRRKYATGANFTK